MSASQISTTKYSSNFGKQDVIEMNMEKDWGTGFYMLYQGKDAFYSHNDYTRSTSGLVDLVAKLKKSSPPLDSDFVPPSSGISKTIDITAEIPFYNEPDIEFTEFLRNINSHLKSTGYKYQVNSQLNQIKKTLQNSEGTQVLQILGNVLIDIVIYDNETSNSITLNLGGIQKTDLEYTNIITRIDEITKLLNQFSTSRKIPPGSFDCILSPDTAYSLIHESIGHGVEADQVLSTNSFLFNKIGHKVASSEITLTDDPHLRGIGWSEYDDEGTKTKGTLLVEDGILVDILHTRKTAELMGGIPTGNARVASYLNPPEPRQSNLFVEPKDKSLDELCEELQTGIYLGPSFVASTSIYSGELQIETQYGFLIENGELSALTKPVTLTGNALNILKHVKSVGKDLEKFPTECLKDESRLYIGAYCPHLLIEDQYLQ